MLNHFARRFWNFSCFARLFAVLITGVLFSGCAPARMDPAAWRDSRIDAVWPRLPETPRIRLLRIIQGPEDVIDPEKGVVGKIVNFMVGDSGENIGFFTPQCITADGSGRVYVADPSLGLIHRYDLAAREVSYIFQAGTRPFESPVGVALDAENNLYVTDSQSAAVYKLNSDGGLVRELDGKGNFKRPAGIAVTKRGDKIIADIIANRVFIFDSQDVFKGELKIGREDEAFNRPAYVAVDNEDSIYVTDTMNFKVRIFDSRGNYVRSQGQIGDTPGSFARPKGVALDSDRNLYVLDSIFANYQIFNQKGQLLIYVGQEGVKPGEMMLPSGIFIDSDDRIYVADTFNRRLQIYQYLKEKVRK